MIKDVEIKIGLEIPWIIRSWEEDKRQILMCNSNWLDKQVNVSGSALLFAGCRLFPQVTSVVWSKPTQPKVTGTAFHRRLPTRCDRHFLQAKQSTGLRVHSPISWKTASGSCRTFTLIQDFRVKYSTILAPVFIIFVWNLCFRFPQNRIIKDKINM